MSNDIQVPLWFLFLRIRHLLILEFLAGGETIEKITQTLSMDPVQTRMISQTDPDDSTLFPKMIIMARYE